MNNLRKVFNLISITIMSIVLIYTALNYQELNDIIPSHFNIRGEADAYSTKSNLLYHILVFILIVSLFLFVQKAPDKYNNLFKFKEKNKERLSKISSFCISVLMLITTILLSDITLKMQYIDLLPFIFSTIMLIALCFAIMGSIIWIAIENYK